MPRKTGTLEIRPRIRLMRGDEILLGPGKADLLEAIDRTGSIRQASRELGMSYMRAWTLVKTMNDGFVDPVVESARGGSGRGGATLTTAGRTVLDIYREMERDSKDAMNAAEKRLRKLVK